MPRPRTLAVVGVLAMILPLSLAGYSRNVRVRSLIADVEPYGVVDIEPHHPEWLDSWFEGRIYIPFVDRVDSVTLGCKPISIKGIVVDSQMVEPPTPAVLSRLADLPEARRLDLSGADVSDDDLAQLAGLRTVEDLSLSGFAITDDGLRHLRGWRRLQRLSLVSTSVSDEGLSHLADLTALTDLEIRESAIRGPGLGKLARITTLRKLAIDLSVKVDGTFELPGTVGIVFDHGEIDDTRESLKALGSLSLLTDLRLIGVPVDDVGLEQVSQMPALQVLDLSGTLVGKYRLGQLSKLKNLQTLSLRHTRVSDDGVAQLAILPWVVWLHLGTADLSPEGLKQLQSLREDMTVTFSHQYTPLGRSILK